MTGRVSSACLNAIFADFKLAFARAMAALTAVQSAEERERILAELRQAGELMLARVDAAFEMLD